MVDDAGRVTELTAKPLLAIFYPELAGFGQPLAGEVAARRDLLCSIPFLTATRSRPAMLIDVLRAPASTRWPRSTSAAASTARSACSRSADVLRGARAALLTRAGATAVDAESYLHAANRPTGCGSSAAWSSWSSARRWRSTIPRISSLCAASTPISTARCSGSGASLLRDAEGNFSPLAVRALEACHRAGVEVVIKSGRRKAQVHEDARLIGQPAFIYEMGCGTRGRRRGGLPDRFVRARGGRERPRPDRAAPAHPRCCWRRSRAGSSTTRPGTSTATSLTSSVATSTLEEVEELFAERGLDLRLVDNGITGRRSAELNVDEVHVYHLIPAAAGKANAVAAHMRRRGLSPEEYDRDRRLAWRSGGRRRDGPVLPGCERPRARPADPRLVREPAERDRDRGADDGGFYEAIVRSLAEAARRRGPISPELSTIAPSRGATSRPMR